MEEKTWKIYKVPFYYDEADEAWTFKYLNDMTIVYNVLENHTPDHIVVAIKAAQWQHDFLISQSDVDYA